jgi:hypothetical protein
MEIKATLNKPYTFTQRKDFIIQQNRINHYDIVETDLALEAWGYTEEEEIERVKQSKNEDIDAKIAELQQMALPDLLQGNTNNVSVYLAVIDSLKQTKE